MEFHEMTEPILSEEDEAAFEKVFALREAVFKALEDKRAEKVIGKSLEAHVYLHLDEQKRELVEKLIGEELAQWLIVSKVSFTEDELPEVMDHQVAVENIEGYECPRCWNIVEVVNNDGLCARCEAVLKNEN